MASSMLMKTNIRASIMSMRNSALALPLTNASSLANGTKTEAFQFPLEQQPQLPGSSSFPLIDFHTSNQRVLQSLGFKQVSPVFTIQECLKNHMETRGSSKKKIVEDDEEDVDELDNEEEDLSDGPDEEALLNSDEDDDYHSEDKEN